MQWPWAHLSLDCWHLELRYLLERRLQFPEDKITFMTSLSQIRGEGGVVSVAVMVMRAACGWRVLSHCQISQ